MCLRQIYFNPPNSSFLLFFLFLCIFLICTNWGVYCYQRKITYRCIDGVQHNVWKHVKIVEWLCRANYHMPFSVRTFKTDFLKDFQVGNTLLLTVVTMLYAIIRNWNVTLFDQSIPSSVLSPWEAPFYYCYELNWLDFTRSGGICLSLACSTSNILQVLLGCYRWRDFPFGRLRS